MSDNKQPEESKIKDIAAGKPQQRLGRRTVTCLPAVTFYQLTYFDTKENCRKKYLNGTAWESIQEAEGEYINIKSVERARKRMGFHGARTKWALEAVSNKKRTLIKTLS